MTDKELKVRMTISNVVSHFISFFPEAVQVGKEGGDAYVEDLQRRDYEVIRLYLESYMDGFYEHLYNEHAEELDNDTLRFIVTSVYGLMLKYTSRSTKRMNCQYEEVYGKK